jgi:hypothetical protein
VANSIFIKKIKKENQPRAVTEDRPLKSVDNMMYRSNTFCYQKSKKKKSRAVTFKKIRKGLADERGYP